jgi:hypothetical protein
MLSFTKAKPTHGIGGATWQTLTAFAIGVNGAATATPFSILIGGWVSMATCKVCGGLSIDKAGRVGGCLECDGTGKVDYIGQDVHQKWVEPLISPNGDISLWVPITDMHDIAIIGKAIEESNELGSRLARCLIQGWDAIDPDPKHKGKTNRELLADEAADLYACLDIIERNKGIKADRNRVARKYHGFLDWHQLIRQYLKEKNNGNP